MVVVDLLSLSNIVDYVTIKEKKLAEVTGRSMYLPREVADAIIARLTGYARKSHQVL